MATKISLRERHAVETRRAIVESANALFIAQGYDATTVDEIAVDAGVSPRTFFRYFPTKDALLFHDLDEKLERVRDEINARPDGERAAESLVAVLSDVAEQLLRSEEQRALAAQLLRERPSLRSYQRTTIAHHTDDEIIEALARRDNVDPDDLGLRSVVAAIASCFDIAIRDWFDAGGGDDFQERFHHILRICRNGFPTV